MNIAERVGDDQYIHVIGKNRAFQDESYGINYL